jgi:hypothetical protein
MMRRAAIERPRTLRVWRSHSRLIHNKHPTTCPCDQQPGRFRKGQRRAGCSRAHCWLCSWPKLTHQPTPQECRAAFALYE